MLVEAVGSAYREWKSERIERIAGDVLAAAFSRGTWHQVPMGGPLRWVVQDTGGPCPDCDDDVLAGSLPKGAYLVASPQAGAAKRTEVYVFNDLGTNSRGWPELVWVNDKNVWSGPKKIAFDAHYVPRNDETVNENVARLAKLTTGVGPVAA